MKNFDSLKLLVTFLFTSMVFLLGNACPLDESTHFQEDETFTCATCQMEVGVAHTAALFSEDFVQANANATRCISIVWEADYNYYQLHGSNTTNRINQVIQEIESIYNSNGITIDITTASSNIIQSYASDPYKNPSSLPCCFSGGCSNNIANVWCTFKSRMTSKSYDMALLFSGKRLSNHGVALPATSCTKSACVVGIGVNKSSGALLSVNYEAKIHAHEMGHILSPNGNHDSNTSNLMHPNNPYGSSIYFQAARKTNVQNSLNGSCYQCSFTPPTNTCTAPASSEISASNIGTTTARLNYSGSATYASYQYRAAGTSTWNYLSFTNTGNINVSGLSPNRQYQYQVRKWCNLWGAWSTIKTFTTTGGGGSGSCSAPTNVNAYNATSSTCTLSWNPVSGASQYSLIYYNWSSSQWVTFGSTTNTSLTITGLSANQWWCFAIKSQCGATLSPQSGYDCVKTSSSLIAGNGEGGGIRIEEDQQGGAAMKVEEQIGINVYPNPFKDQTTIELNLLSERSVTVYVSDVMGKKIAILANEEMVSAGNHQFTFDGSRLTPGLYYFTVVAGDYKSVQKIILMK